MTPAGAERQRERDRSRAARLLKPHAPPDWQQRFRTDELLDAVIDGAPIHMFVMAADIRESTTLMKESIRVRTLRARDGQVRQLGPPRDPRAPAAGSTSSPATGSSPTGSCRTTSRPPYEERFVQTAGDVADTAHLLVELFHHRVLEDFRSNSRNLSVGRRAVDGARRRARLPDEDRRRADGGRAARRGRRPDGDRGDASRGRSWRTCSSGARLHDGQDGVYEALGVTSTRDDPSLEGVPEGPGGLRADVRVRRRRAGRRLISRRPAAPSRPASAASPTRPTPSGPGRPGAPPRCGA